MTQSRDTVGSPVNTLQGRFGVRIPAGVKKNILSLPNRPEWLRRPPSLLLNGYRDIFMTVKWQGTEVNPSPQLVAG